MKFLLLFFSSLVVIRGDGWWEIRHRHGHKGQPGYSEEGGIAVSILSDNVAPSTDKSMLPTNSLDSLGISTIHELLPTETLQPPTDLSLSTTPVIPATLGFPAPAAQSADADSLEIPSNTAPILTTSSTTGSTWPTTLGALSTRTVEALPISPLVSTCPNPLTCRKSTACSTDRKCLCQPSVDGVGYCLSDVTCSKLKDCTANSECGDGTRCMVTCCTRPKCLELPFLCGNPGVPSRVFAKREEAEAGADEETTNGVERRRDVRKAK